MASLWCTSPGCGHRGSLHWVQMHSFSLSFSWHADKYRQEHSGTLPQGYLVSSLACPPMSCQSNSLLRLLNELKESLGWGVELRMQEQNVLQFSVWQQPLWDCWECESVRLCIFSRLHEVVYVILHLLQHLHLLLRHFCILFFHEWIQNGCFCKKSTTPS